MRTTKLLTSKNKIVIAPMAALLIVFQVQQSALIVEAQTVERTPETSVVMTTDENAANRKQTWTDTGATLTKYVDTVDGLSADDAVAYALAHNGELLAARTEIEAAQDLVAQAELRPNPKLNVQRKEQIGGADNDTMIGGSLPLELGGRRATRIAVAERELDLRKQLLAERERTLAAGVRDKFGEALAAILKLSFTENLLSATRRGYKLVLARVIEGRTAPLEQNMVLVEVNRIRSVRETSEGKVEIELLELRNLIGMETDAPLRVRGDFDGLIGNLPPLSEATTHALQSRPDLLAARASETLAAAQIEQARAGGRLDAELTGRYERNNFSFAQRGVNGAGQLVPIQGIFHSVAVGVTFDLPVRNKNQGAIAAAAAQAEVARQRREYAELTVRREVAVAYARYHSAARAMEIYRVGVRGQAGANLNVVRQTYELGAKNLLDYINEQRRFIELENDYINAQLETYSASVEIKRATAAAELIKR
ncbi:MAG: TolC family protein [Pyrinomonadaceae bacterium]